jgi:hypothetical protein
MERMVFICSRSLGLDRLFKNWEQIRPKKLGAKPQAHPHIQPSKMAFRTFVAAILGVCVAVASSVIRSERLFLKIQLNLPVAHNTFGHFCLATPYVSLSSPNSAR